MNKLLFVLTALVFSTTVCGQNLWTDSLRADVVDFVTKHCLYRDPNPIYQEEADSIHCLLIALVSEPNSEVRLGFKAGALDAFYDNSIGTFEDAVDVERCSVRRAWCCVALGLLGDEDRYGAFFGDARRSLENVRPGVQYRQELAAVELLRIFAALDFESSAVYTPLRLNMLERDLAELSGDGCDEFLKDCRKLIDQIRKLYCAGRRTSE